MKSLQRSPSSVRVLAASHTQRPTLRRSHRAAASRELACHPRAVPDARRFVGQTLAAWRLADADTAQLLVSELVTNAVQHAAGPIVLTVTIAASTLRFAVSDADPTTPRRREADMDEESGRGMILLQELSCRWGVRPTGTGKTVWFDLSARLTPEADYRPLTRRDACRESG